MHVSQNWIDIAYLIAACLFVVGIKGLTKPKTAVRGNLLAAAGMGVAAVVTLLNEHIVTYEIIIAGVVVGGLIGAVMAKKVQMTSMPQMIALLNGFGGGASFAVASAEFFRGSADSTVSIIATGAAVLIGAVTLTGSLVAFAKLQELIDGKPMGFPGMKLVNGLLFIGSVVAVGYLVVNPGNEAVFWGLVAAAAVLGLFLVLPIGGADMPVVIALLNSYSGVAASAAGFVMGNSALIITGSLVGASGLILTSIMCKAMNRSLTNVLFGVMAEAGEAMDEDEVYAGKVKSTSSEEVAMLLETAQRVVIVPGFGLAMAQAQHAVRDMADTLEAMGCEVEYAIHPVAGRMPGHMNVLLAEAGVPYDIIHDLEDINEEFAQADVAIVLGANDVVNPAARTRKSSPIYGMPILNVDQARQAYVVKRGQGKGYSGVENELFFLDNTSMVYGDAQKVMVQMIEAVKSLG